MMIDPVLVARYWVAVLVLAAIVITGKIVSVAFVNGWSVCKVVCEENGFGKILR